MAKIPVSVGNKEIINKKPVITSQSKKRTTKRVYSYSRYIYKVLKQVHPNTGISQKGMSILNSFMNDIFERLAQEASRLVGYNNKATLTSKDIQTAARLILPGGLGKHAVSEGTRAVTPWRGCRPPGYE